MQYQLPFFPSGTKMINEAVGYCEKDGTVYYLHYGKPIYCHAKEDLNGYRFALANLVANNLCKICEVCQAMGVNRKNVERYVKAYKEHGTEYFFNRKEHRGECHKVTATKMTAIQSDLDQGVSMYRAALNHEVSEAAIRYHIVNGNLKKKNLLRLKSPE